MSKRRLLTLLGIILWTFASAAMAQMEIQIDDNQAAPAKSAAAPPCPCLTPTCTPTCSCQPATPASAKALTAPAVAPAGSTGSPQAAKAQASAKASDEEITIGDDMASPAAPAPSKGTKTKAVAAKSEDEEDISLDDTSVPAPKATSKGSAPSANAPQAGTVQTGSATSTQTGTGMAAAATTGPAPAGKGQTANTDRFEPNYEANQWGVLDKPLFRTTLDGIYSRAFSPAGFNGFGGDFRFEVQFYRNFSMGLYYDLTFFSTPVQTLVGGPLGMFGRVILKHQGPMEIYLIGGGGINSMVGANSPVNYPGDFHAFAGLGLTQSFGDHWGLDANAVYNYYSPDANPLRTVSARLGLTYETDLAGFLDSLL